MSTVDELADRLETEYDIVQAKNVVGPELREAVRQLRHLIDRHGVYLTRLEVRNMGADGIAELWRRHDHTACQTSR
jgi:hypothetical protein